MREFQIVLRKDLLLLIRSRDVLVVLFSLSLLLGIVMSSALGSAYLSPSLIQKILAALVWTLFLFVATISVERSFDEEVQMAGGEGVVLAGVHPSLLYLSKVLTLSLLSLLTFAATSFTLVILLNSPYPLRSFFLFLPGILVSFGYAALATLCGAMSATSRLRSAFLSLILIPLLFPLFFGAVELSTQLLLDGQIDFSRPWLPLLVLIDFLYTCLGCLLYRFILR
jgi:ABC-type transport system involved in cytochrome c biogenesis permease component